MDRPTSIPLRIGDWCVNPATGQMSREGEAVRVEARTMRLLLCLAQHAGEVVSVDDLLTEVWSGVVVTQDSVYQAVASLRRLLGDDAKQPAYIATVPRLGYRMVASVGPWGDSPLPLVAGGRQARDGASMPGGPPANVTPPRSTPPPRGAGRGRRIIVVAVAAAAIFLTLILAVYFLNGVAIGPTVSPGPAAAPPKSVAVLPFLDLTTQAMNEEYFADGMTEELIDKLSKVPGLRVPGPTSSFYFKGKQLKVGDIARSLGVAYVLDGSVRKSDTTLRVAARLIRADDGYVIWSETYDRPLDNKLAVQDDIASEVTRALRASIN